MFNFANVRNFCYIRTGAGEQIISRDMEGSYRTLYDYSYPRILFHEMTEEEETQAAADFMETIEDDSSWQEAEPDMAEYLESVYHNGTFEDDEVIAFHMKEL